MREQSTIASGRVVSNARFKDTFFNLVGCGQVVLANCGFENCVIRLEACEQIRIVDCVFDQCKGSHFIQCDPDSPIPCRKIVIADNRFLGNGQPFYRDSVGGTPINNGACGDVISIRNAKSFHVVNNYIADGGEIGITVLHGSEDGVVAGNTIVDNDAMGIQIGITGHKPVSRVAIANNFFHRCGLNRAGGFSPWGCIQIASAAAVQVIGNQVLEPGGSLPWGLIAQHCRGLTVSQNVFRTTRSFRIPKRFEATVTELLTDTKPAY